MTVVLLLHVHVRHLQNHLVREALHKFLLKMLMMLRVSRNEAALVLPRLDRKRIEKKIVNKMRRKNNDL
ncbi:unnamed protein product [Meloidogyne enterolobii]|uniref:Uncharacterized protein n=1 Tax=Meloidogyne enterolobii TaxID=390850 RepID=A0ACB1B5H5_MELEN